MNDLDSILSDLSQVAWQELNHAYGYAVDVPTMLEQMVSADKDERDQGWNGIWGAVNHQGDFYNSTVATISFMVRLLACEQAHGREHILSYLYSRYLDAPLYGGDPMLDDPPSGAEMSIPMTGFRPDAAEDQPDWDKQPPMELSAWHTGRAIRAGVPTYQQLLSHPDKEIAGNAANLLILWHDTRDAGNAALHAAIDQETDGRTKGELLLKYGVYAGRKDIAAFQYWISESEPIEVRTAALICWARVIEPDPLPAALSMLIEEATHPDCGVFGELPWEGVYNRGLWTLPSNLAQVILPLSKNANDELRWRAVQGLMPGRKGEAPLSRKVTVPVLLHALNDRTENVRSAAALALGEIGMDVLKHAPDCLETLFSALEDEHHDVAGHVARLLVQLAPQMNHQQKETALEKMQRAEQRFTGKNVYVFFMSTGIPADRFLQEQQAEVRNPQTWNIPELLDAYAFPNEDHSLKPIQINEQLADIYCRDPEQAVSEAMIILKARKDRTKVLGAMKWLATLGPRAEIALPAIQRCGKGKFDDYIDQQSAAACNFIRENVEFAEDETQIAPATELQLINQITHEVRTTNSLESTFSQWMSLLTHQNWLVKYHAAKALSELEEVPQASTDLLRQLSAAFQSLLKSESQQWIAVEERFRHQDQILLWRKQRQSLRGATIRAILTSGCETQGTALLTAMLQEATCAEMRSGATISVTEYKLSEWQLASQLAGQVPTGEILIRQAREECHRRRWSDNQYDPVAQVAQEKLDEIILPISGRLVAHDEF